MNVWSPEAPIQEALLPCLGPTRLTKAGTACQGMEEATEAEAAAKSEFEDALANCPF